MLLFLLLIHSDTRQKMTALTSLACSRIKPVKPHKVLSTTDVIRIKADYLQYLIQCLTHGKYSKILAIIIMSQQILIPNLANIQPF